VPLSDSCCARSGRPSPVHRCLAPSRVRKPAEVLCVCVDEDVCGGDGGGGRGIRV
jgi:hypothetical protein